MDPAHSTKGVAFGYRVGFLIMKLLTTLFEVAILTLLGMAITGHYQSKNVNSPKLILKLYEENIRDRSRALERKLTSRTRILQDSTSTTTRWPGYYPSPYTGKKSE